MIAVRKNAGRARGLCAAALAGLCCGAAAAAETMSYAGQTWSLHIGENARAYAAHAATAPDGRPAMRFELRSGDCMKNDINDCATHRERAELRSRDEAAIGAQRWYRYSIFLTPDFPEIGVEEIMGQLHDGDAPVLSNRHSGGRMAIVVQSRKGAKAVSVSVPMPRGRWVAFLNHCLWSKGADGFCNVSVDGKAALTYRGPTLTPGTSHGPYLKIGLYRSHLERRGSGKTPTGVVYFSDVRTGAGAPD